MTYLEKTMEALDRSHSPFHVVDVACLHLLDAGFEELLEQKPFLLQKGGCYFVRRNSSSLIAFKIPSAPRPMFKVSATHTDSPTFKLKPNPVIRAGNILKLNVEPYGGMIMSSWLDRPLSIAGRVMIKTGKGIETRLLDVTKDLLSIPNVCIHMNREVNKGYAWNPAKDLLPIFATVDNDDEFDFKDFLIHELGEEGEVLSFDLFLYVREVPRLVGLRGDFLSSPRLDDLSSTYSVLFGFIDAKTTDSIDIYCAFDNEEVGSLTRQGAHSTFLKDVLSRISSAIFEEKNAYETALANGFMMSVDNAHANHPNHPELSDATTNVLLNNGIVLKYNAAQKYATDSLSGALVKAIAEKANIKVQEYTNRSDLPGGSTLGNISNSEVSFAGADIGLPQLAMHSCNEVCGSEDIESMALFIKKYYETKMAITGPNIEL